MLLDQFLPTWLAYKICIAHYDVCNQYRYNDNGLGNYEWEKVVLLTLNEPYKPNFEL